MELKTKTCVTLVHFEPYRAIPIWPWVKTQIVPQVNIRFNPTTKIGNLKWVVNSPIPTTMGHTHTVRLVTFKPPGLGLVESLPWTRPNAR